MTGSIPAVRTTPRSHALVAALVAILAACGPSGVASPAPSTATASPTPASPPATPSASPSPSLSPTPAASGALDDLRIALEPVAGGFDRPLFVTHAGDGSGRVYVVEQGGFVWLLEGGTRLDAPFLDISDRVTEGGERGLLGLAFHPAYPDDPRVFVDYTATNGDEVVSSFEPGLDADALDPDSERIVIRIQDPYGNHNGGALAFDPQGALLIANGDGGSGGDPGDRAQDPRELLGKILRLDVDQADGDAGYAIPAENPHQADAFRPEIAHHGLRNPWRLSVDRATGDLWIGDVGQGAIEEVDVARAGQLGLDFGWNVLEGTQCYKPSTGCDTQGRTMPVAEYTHDDGCTIVGGYVYRGTAHPALIGRYFFGDYCSGKLWALDAADPDGARLVAETGHTISSFGEDETGELYLTDISSGDILRLAPAA
jgi:glucose/arabinose dehydrogenase